MIFKLLVILNTRVVTSYYNYNIMFNEIYESIQNLKEVFSESILENRLRRTSKKMSKRFDNFWEPKM